MDSWDYQGTFLNQFPANYRGAVGNEFCKVIRDGAETPQEVLMAVCAKQTRYGEPSELGRLILQKGVLDSEAAYGFAMFLLEREALPWDEKQRLKAEAKKENPYVKDRMATQSPTEKQFAYLKSLGCDATPLSKLEASELIEIYKKRKDAA